MKRLFSLIIGIGVITSDALPAAAQTTGASGADSLVLAGDVAARASNHREAIKWYELAVRRDSALYGPLLAKLGRQYLWADKSSTAARMLGAYLRANPTDCEVRRDAALALSWKGALDDAQQAWRELGVRCPSLTGDARLGEAQVLRWANQPRAAASRYRSQLGHPDASVRRRAALGLGYAYLDLGQPRVARTVFDSLLRAGDASSDAFEGRARASWDLGQRTAAHAILAQAQAADVFTKSLSTLDALLAVEDNASVSPTVRGFRDRDRTNYRAYELTTAVGGGNSLNMNATARRAELRGQGALLQSDEGSLAWRARPHAAVAVAMEAGVRSWDAIDRTDGFGEVTLTVLPNDAQRVDMSAARLLVTDNVAAVNAGLAGSFASVGVTQRLGTHTAVALSADRTRWSTGNTRVRYRGTLTRRFDGVPSVTLEWPTVVQQYDAPFAFGFFSPDLYVETGPALIVYRRLQRVWHLSAYGRAGTLRETGGDWQPLALTRVSLEREVARHWGVRADGSWTNSNLAGSAGFQRTALSLQITARW